MIDSILTQKVTPMLKCLVLFLFIFTAKVLTTRPQDAHDSQNSIHQSKPNHYVRTFTKYHHRRPQWNHNNEINWPATTQNHEMHKRSVDIPNSNELINTIDIPSLNQFTTDFGKGNIVDISEKKSSKEDVEKRIGGKFKLKPAIVVWTDPPTTMGPRIKCLYKINSPARTIKLATPSYEDYTPKNNDQLMVETEIFGKTIVSEETLPNGDTVQVQECMDPRASCYTLWHQDTFGNVTVLGQGCWRSSHKKGRKECDKCVRVTSLLPATRFCCCTTSYCNANFTSLEEDVTSKAEPVVTSASNPNYVNMTAAAILSLIAVIVTAILFIRFYCKKRRAKSELSLDSHCEKGDIMGSGPDALATGLLCVDNLTLLEHIGSGKFGSVWRGRLGGTLVAVKMYNSAAACQRETAIYALPQMSHSNLLKYYGTDTRPSLSGERSHLIVLELCSMTLRARLELTPLQWSELAHFAHGLASAVAHLHNKTLKKPCVVHRDVNSNNVLISLDGRAKLADLGLAQAIHPRKDNSTPSRITEAGTLRYLSPEALEGALDLRGARAALCAVDVFALGLVLWEMLWRTSGAHLGSTPLYSPPYQHLGVTDNPTLDQMQSLVSRNKARPPLPKGPVPESRALKMMCDTCDECWDHDAEARLTAVCVEERMAELKQMLLSHGPLIHDNNLHPHAPPETSMTSTAEDKNSNIHVDPAPYNHPHIGRNACIERNTHTNTNTHTVQLIHKSLKDITACDRNTDAPRVQNIEECLSVARVNLNRPIIHQDYENSDRLNEIRSYQRPLDYVQNDVSNHDVERGPKETNLHHEVKDKSKWGIKKFFEKKFNNSKLDTEVKLISENSGNASLQNGRIKTSIVNDKQSNVNFDRPSKLVLNQDRNVYFEAPCTLSPPNRTLSPTMMIESQLNRQDNIFGYKEIPRDDNEAKTPNQIFAVIVPKMRPSEYTNSIEMRSKTSQESSSSVKNSISLQSMFKSGNSESEDSTIKKRLSCDNRIITNSNASNSGRSSRASINLELKYINNEDIYLGDSPFDINSDCSSEDEHLMLLSENGGSKITMQSVPKTDVEKKKYQNEVLKEASQTKTDFSFNKFQNKYTNFDNEFSDPNDKENLVNGYSTDNPVYFATLNGDMNNEIKFHQENQSPKPSVRSLNIKRQHSLEQVSDIFSSSGDIHLQNPAGRVKTPGDLPIAVRKARRDRALQKGRASEGNRLSLYDDRMMFGNSL